ncbi:unnamed protein product [Owenia fusiformis]|uniref:Uncharacterized protein n=1 Tax=Owenia fusiformis TaxID=6347 RepID=A0A8S4MYH7_OWEFU|nr:unnamed protein product [Owenia fusiformis]
MGNSLNQWRATIGKFEGGKPRHILICTTGSERSEHTGTVLVILMMLLVIGGIEMNPGPNPSKSEITEKMYDLGCKIKEYEESKTESELKKQADLMCELGDEFIESAETSPTWYEHYVWASGLFNAARCRLEKQPIQPNSPSTLMSLLHRFRRWFKIDYDLKYIDQRIQQIDTNFLNRLSKKNTRSTNELTKKYKEALETIRNYSENTVNDIIDNDMVVDDVTSEIKPEYEDKTIEHSKVYYNDLTEKLLEFYRSIITNCMSVLDLQNCKYRVAIMALGSLSRKEVTAYSDIEWAILFDPLGQPDAQVRDGLRMLVYYVHLHVLNLGETILNNLDIPVLTNFNNKLLPRPKMTDVNFWDNVTTRGVSFDGTHPSASKTPIGRKSRKNLTKPETLELIMTIDEMTKYQFTDESLKEGYRLSDVLMNSALITGDETLWHDYNDKVHNILQQKHSKKPNMSIGAERAMKTLNDDLKKFLEKPLTSESFSKAMHAKHDVYRLATISINILKLLHGCKSFAPLDVLEELFEKNILTERAKKDLQLMVCIATNLRHMVYSKYKQQKENISFLFSKSDKDSIDSANVLPVRGYTAIIQFYTVFMPWSQFLISQKNNTEAWKHQECYMEDSNVVKGELYKDMNFSKKAVFAYQRELEKQKKIAEHENKQVIISLQLELGLLYQTRAEFKDALQINNEALVICKTIYGGNPHPDVAGSLHNIGLVYKKMGEYIKAMKYYEDSLSMDMKIHGDNPHPSVATSLNNIGSVYDNIGEYTKAMKYYEDSLSMKIKIHGDNPHPSVATSLHNIGSLYDDMGEYTKAMKYYEDSLSMRMKIHGDNPHPDVASSLHNIGSLYDDMGEYTKAMKYYEDSLSMEMKIHGDNPHPSVAASLHNIGLVYKKMGEYIKAMKYYEDSLSIKMKIHGDNPHPSVATSLNNIGSVYDNMGEYIKAMKYYGDSLSMKIKIHGDNPHPSVATSLHNIGLVYKNMGEYTKAMKYYEDSLSMMMRIYGDNPHPSVASSLHNIGSVYDNMGEYTKAMKYYEDSLSMMMKIHGDNPHPSVATSLNNIGSVYDNMGEYIKARKYYEDSLSMMMKIHGDNPHPSVATSLNNIGSVYDNMGEYIKAMKYYEDSLSMKIKIHGDNPHPSVASSLHNIGSVYDNMGEYTKAMKYYEDSLSMEMKIHGDNPHPSVATSLNNIGSVYDNMGEYIKARKYYEDSLSMMMKIHGDNPHPSVATSLNNIGSVYDNMGEYIKAMKYYEDSLSMKIKIHGDNPHPSVASSLHNIGSVYDNMGEYIKAMKYYEDSLSMEMRIYGDNPHPSVASSLHNIGSVYNNTGEFTKAMKYYNECLAIERKVYGSDLHPEVAKTLRNIARCQEAQINQLK